jgi:hypothetical protein
MKYRFTLFGFGFVIGLVLVFFFLGGKKASCNWLPNDRMLNIIRSKEIIFTDAALKSLEEKKMDTLQIYSILKSGKINFSKSMVKNKPCRKYHIEGTKPIENTFITVELCDSTATVLQVENVVKHE